jgi:hypothetical protein
MTDCCAWAWPFKRSILNGLEFACPSVAERRRGLHLFFKKKVERVSPTFLFVQGKLIEQVE